MGSLLQSPALNFKGLSVFLNSPIRASPPLNLNLRPPLPNRRVVKWEAEGPGPSLLGHRDLGKSLYVS